MQISFDTAHKLFRTFHRKADDHSVILEFFYSFKFRAADDMGVDLPDQRQFFFEQIFQRINRYSNRNTDPGLIDCGQLAVIDDTANLMIIDDLNIIGTVDQLCRSDADLHHRSLEITCLDGIPDIVGFLKHDTQAGQNIRHDIFGSQGDGQRKKTDGSQHGRRINPEIAQCQTDSSYEDNVIAEASDQPENGLPFSVRQTAQHPENNLHGQIDQVFQAEYQNHRDD